MKRPQAPKARTSRVDDWEVRTEHFTGDVKDLDGYQNTVNGTHFDEIVVGKDKSPWFHAERLDEREWYFGLYGVDHKAVQLYIHLDKNGRVASVTVGDDQLLKV